LIIMIRSTLTKFFIYSINYVLTILMYHQNLNKTIVINFLLISKINYLLTNTKKLLFNGK